MPNFIRSSFKKHSQFDLMLAKLDCIAATIAVESTHHAPRMGGLGTESVCAAQKD